MWSIHTYKTCQNNPKLQDFSITSFFYFLELLSDKFPLFTFLIIVYLSQFFIIFDVYWTQHEFVLFTGVLILMLCLMIAAFYRSHHHGINELDWLHDVIAQRFNARNDGREMVFTAIRAAKIDLVMVMVMIFDWLSMVLRNRLCNSQWNWAPSSFLSYSIVVSLSIIYWS